MYRFDSERSLRVSQKERTERKGDQMHNGQPGQC